MIDLHCHMLPGIDDGASDLDAALAMARIAADDGIRVTACTPHIYAGLYDNCGPGIKAAVEDLRARLMEADICLELTYGADTHLAPDLATGLRSGKIPSLNGGRYFLLEPPHHVVPPRLEESVFELVVAGYTPVVTHPERLTWIRDHYRMFARLVQSGAWMQVTAGSLTGRFGSQAKYWGERLLADGLVHILATDAHSLKARAPRLGEGRQAAESWVGADEAEHLVVTRPQGILDDIEPAQLPGLPDTGCNGLGSPGRDRGKKNWMSRWLGRRGA